MAADANTVRQEQADAAGTISGAKRREVTIAVQDESIFLRTGTNERNLWSRIVDPVAVSRHGRRDRTAVFDALQRTEPGLCGSMKGSTARPIPTAGQLACREDPIW